MNRHLGIVSLKPVGITTNNPTTTINDQIEREKRIREMEDARKMAAELENNKKNSSKG